MAEKRRIGLLAWVWRLFFGDPAPPVPQCPVKHSTCGKVYQYCRYGHCFDCCRGRWPICKCPLPAELPAKREWS